MFIVPTRTPGVEIVRNVKVMGDDHAGDGGMHAHIRYNPVRAPHDAMLRAAARRLQGATRRRARPPCDDDHRQAPASLDMMAERANSRWTQGRLLAEGELVQGMIADSAIEVHKVQVAEALSKHGNASPGLFRLEHISTRMAAA